MIRIYHRFEKWEEYHNGMWKDSVSNKESDIHKTVELIKNTERFSSAMLSVVDNWVVSCEHNLTNVSSNRVAWIGQAASCFVNGVPEWITRKAWSLSDFDKRNSADIEALKAIEIWELEYEAKNRELYRNLGGSWIFGRDTRRSTVTIGGYKQGTIF